MAGGNHGSPLIRWGGLAAIASAVLGIVAELINRIYHVELPLWKTGVGVVYQAAYGFGLAILVLTLLALRQIHTRRGQHYGRLGTISFFIALFGYALQGVGTAVLLLLYLIGGQQAAANMPPGGLIHFPSIIAIIVGTILLGVAVVRAGVLPRWFGIALALLFPLSMLLNAFGIGAIVGSLIWIVLGYTLWSYGDKPVAQRGMDPRVPSM